MSARSRVLLISKPVAPPWNDSSKNLVRDLSSAFATTEPTVLTHSDAGRPAWKPSAGLARTPYPEKKHTYAPGLVQNAHVAALLAFGRDLPDIWNFFFAPNPKTSMVARVLSRARRVKTVQTVCSQPKVWKRNDFFGDVIVALSQFSQAQLKTWGVTADRIRLIYPCVPISDAPSAVERVALRADLDLPTDQAVFIYPGDLEFGGGAELVLEAFSGVSDAVLVMACRDKTPAAAQRRLQLREKFSKLEETNRLRWVGETTRILDYLSASDLVLLPSKDLYGKMDLPLVLLEAMVRERVVLVHASAAASSLCLGGALSTNGDVDQLREKMGKVLADKAWRQERGVRGRQWVTENCSPEVCAAQYESIYKELS